MRTMEEFEKSLGGRDAAALKSSEAIRARTALELQATKKIMEDINAPEEWVDFQSRAIRQGFTAGEAMQIFAQDSKACAPMTEEKLAEAGLTKAPDSKGVELNVKSIMASEVTPGYIADEAIKEMDRLNAERGEEYPNTPGMYHLGQSGIIFEKYPGAEDEIAVSMEPRKADVYMDEQKFRRFISNEIIGKVPVYSVTETLYDSAENTLESVNEKRLSIVKDPVKMEALHSALMVAAGDDSKFRMTVREQDPRFDQPGRAQDNDYYIQNGKITVAVSGDLIKDNEVLLKALAERKMTDGKGIPDINTSGDRSFVQTAVDHANVEAQEERVRMIAAIVGKNYGLFSTEPVVHANYETGEPESWLVEDMKEAKNGNLWENDIVSAGDILKEIYNDAASLTEDVNRTLERAGYDHNLDRTIMSKAELERFADQKTRAMEAASDTIDKTMATTDKILSSNPTGHTTEMLGIVTEQLNCVRRLHDTINYMGANIAELTKKHTPALQNAYVKMIDAEHKSLITDLNQLERQSYELNIAFNKAKDISLDNTKLAALFARGERNDSQGQAIQQLAEAYPQLKNLSEAQLHYLSTSQAVNRIYTNMVAESPEKAVDGMINRAHDIDKIVAQNGTFVEFTNTESWMFDKPIVADGALAHPAVANEIISQAETQIEGLNYEAKAAGSKEVPTPVCRFNVYYMDPKNQALTNQWCCVSLGDGAQHSLTDVLGGDHTSYNYNARQAVGEALKEEGASRKILYDKTETAKAEPERTVGHEKAVSHENTRSRSIDEWKADIKEKRAELDAQKKGQEQKKDHQHDTKTR